MGQPRTGEDARAYILLPVLGLIPARGWLLFLLHVLLLLGVPLLQLLGLLLVPLLDLLLSGFIGVLLRHPLMILLLLLLEFLVILLLPLIELLLLLLVLLILLRVPCVWGRRAFVRLKVLRVGCGGGARDVVLRARN